MLRISVNYMKIKTVIGITGMPGSGKSVFATFCKEYGYDVVIMGDVIRAKVREKGWEPIPENTNRMMQELRKQHGKDAVAIETIKEIRKREKNGQDKFIIDGIRSNDEVNVFRNEFKEDFVILAIHADPITRFQRLKERKRSDAPQTIKQFNERDEVELGVGLGEAIAFADHVIENNGDIEAFKEKAHEFLSFLEKRSIE